jgi:class 3 adenylate cyclase
VIGDVVNLAARLQAAAPVGGVLISEATFHELGTAAVVEAIPPLQVKGKRDPVTAFVLLRLSAPQSHRE